MFCVKEVLMHLRKLSTHVSLRSQRRLTWVETFCYISNFCMSKDNSGPVQGVICLILQNFYINMISILRYKPYGLANQKFCYIQIYKSWRKKLVGVLRRSTVLQLFNVCSSQIHVSWTIFSMFSNPCFLEYDSVWNQLS